MKPIITKVMGSIAFALFTATALYSQDWKLGGNTDSGPPVTSGLLTNSNFFGATGTASVRLGTGGLSRIFIGGASFANPGFIGIGTGFTNPQSLLHMHGTGGFIPSSFLKLTNTNTGSGNGDGLNIGNLGTVALINQMETAEMFIATASTTRVSQKVYNWIII